MAAFASEGGRAPVADITAAVASVAAAAAARWLADAKGAFRSEAAVSIVHVDRCSRTWDTCRATSPTCWA